MRGGRCRERWDRGWWDGIRSGKDVYRVWQGKVFLGGEGQVRHD